MPSIGSWEVLDELGRGGVGVVMRGRGRDGRLVAIKLLRQLGPERLARFERERRLIAELSAQDGFVPLLDSGDSAWGPYLVMPLLEGGTLADRLRTGPLGAEETARLGRELAQALERAHQRGIVHRDLKPANVLFGGDGRALLADLGLGKHLGAAAGGSASLSRTGEVRGTPAYMAPELLAGSKDAGPAADIYALGAILWECLAGRPAVAGASFVELAARICAGSIPPIETLRPDVPAWLARAIQHALALEPAARPTALDLARALRPPVVAARSSTGTHRAALALLGTGALVALALGTWRLARRPAPATAPAAAASPAAVPSQPPAPAPPPHLGPGREPFDQATELVARGDLQGAVALFTRALELAPDLTLAWHDRAVARAGLGDYPGALSDYDRAIELGPENLASWLGRGSLRQKMRDLRGAEEDFGRAIELDPQLAWGWYLRGHLLFQGTGEERRRGLADLTRAIELDPHFAAAWGDRGTGRAQDGDWAGALADLDRALSEADQGLDVKGQALGDPGFGRVAILVTRGAVKAQLGDLAGAEQDFTRAIELDPGSATAWFNRGTARQRQGNIAGAIADGERYLELAPGSSQAPVVRRELALLRARGTQPGGGALQTQLAQGHDCAARGDLPGAIVAYSRALELDARSAEAWGGRGLARAQSGDLQGGLADLDRAIELDPNVPAYWGNRGTTRRKAGDLDGAIADYRRVLLLSPRDNRAAQLRDEVERLEAERDRR